MLSSMFDVRCVLSGNTMWRFPLNVPSMPPTRITGSGPVASVGGKGQVPELDAVIALVQGQAAAWQVPPAHPLQSSSMRTGG